MGRTYDMSYPGVVAIYLTGKPAPGVGPHDVALALVAATYANGYVKKQRSWSSSAPAWRT